MLLSNLSVKSPIIKKIDNNIFEGMTYQYYISLLFDFVFDFQNKQKKCCKVESSPNYHLCGSGK